MQRLSKAQDRALTWLKERGGSGNLDRWGRVMAGGETCYFYPTTWLQLVAVGRIDGWGSRIRIIESDSDN